MLILIDKSTIRKNPNAGNCSLPIAGPVHISFTMHQAPPQELVMSKSIIIREEPWPKGSPGEISGDILDPSVTEQLKGAGAIIDYYQEVMEVHHRPEPAYLYEYENPAIPCNECGESTLLSDIEERDCGLDGEYSCTVCSKCGEVDSFDIKYESITDALKRA